MNVGFGLELPLAKGYRRSAMKHYFTNCRPCPQARPASPDISGLRCRRYLRQPSRNQLRQRPCHHVFVSTKIFAFKLTGQLIFDRLLFTSIRKSPTLPWWTIGTTISLFVSPSQAICPGKALTSLHDHVRNSVGVRVFRGTHRYNDSLLFLGCFTTDPSTEIYGLTSDLPAVC